MRRLLPLLLLAACDQADPASEAEAPLDGSPDAEALDAALPDAAAPDALLPDGPPPPPPHLAEPQGWVFPDDPITDEWTPEQVTLHETTSEDGALTSPWVEARNCLNVDGGPVANVGVMVQMCLEQQTAFPEADGNYLHIQPPLLANDGNDVFAEVQMYHHVNVAHDYFKDTHGHADLDYPMPAIVNLQFKVTPPISLGGFEPGPDGWYGFPNAAFFPQESWNQLARQFGLAPRDTDSIVFGQDAADFSYDARVIYHEYTHAVIGTGRLQAQAVFDRWGLDNSPASMNEGLADYFAATLADDPTVGLYGIGALAPNLVRDLSSPRRCPADLFDEIHAQGRIVGSTLWAVREAVGAATADAIVFEALMQFGPATTHDQAAELFLAEARSLGVEDAVREVFEAFGFGGGCERVIPWEDWNAAASRDQLPRVVEGDVGPNFPAGTPGYEQLYLDIEPGTEAVELSWSIAGGGGAIGGLGGSPRPLDLAIRAGEPIEFTYAGGIGMNADHVFADIELTRSRQVVTLAGACLPADGGRVFVSFLNPNDGAMNVLTLRRADGPLGEDAEGVVDCNAE